LASRSSDLVRRIIAAWEKYRIDADEFRELDRDRVLVLVRHGGAREAKRCGDRN
jgi:hypothetical protein